MASRSLKLCRSLYRTTPRFSNPKRSFIPPLLIPGASYPFQARPYADISHRPIPIDASPVPSPEKSPANGNVKIHGGDSRIPISSSLNEAELAKFSAISETWWDAEGPFKPLHVMNPTRLSFIRSSLCRHFRKDPFHARPLEGLKIVDVGCGGGILSEPLARMGATVTGIDAVDKNIKIARLHAEMDPLTSSIEYCCTTAENLVEEQRLFDAVIALEVCYGYVLRLDIQQGHLICILSDLQKVIEHVADPAEFCKSLAALTVPDGATLVSTINRTMRSYATAIITAEYLLNWLPRGTHQWSSFLTPEELVLILRRAAIMVQEVAGFVYNPFTGRWTLSDDISVNFITFGTKNSHQNQ